MPKERLSRPLTRTGECGLQAEGRLQPSPCPTRQHHPIERGAAEKACSKLDWRSLFVSTEPRSRQFWSGCGGLESLPVGTASLSNLLASPAHTAETGAVARNANHGKQFGQPLRAKHSSFEPSPGAQGPARPKARHPPCSSRARWHLMGGWVCGERAREARFLAEQPRAHGEFNISIQDSLSK